MNPDKNLYDIALAATDEVLGKGAYATLNAGHPDPGVQAAISRSDLADRMQFEESP